MDAHAVKEAGVSQGAFGAAHAGGERETCFIATAQIDFSFPVAHYPASHFN